MKGPSIRQIYTLVISDLRLPGGEDSQAKPGRGKEARVAGGEGRQCGQDGRKEAELPSGVAKVSQLPGLQGRPKGPFSCVGAAGATQSAMEMVIFYVFFTCVLHMTRCLRVCSQAALGASWEASSA